MLNCEFELCTYDDSIFIFCDYHRELRSSNKPVNKQYDELYKDCKTELQIASCMVPLGNCGITPPALEEFGYDISKLHEGRSDIPAPEFFVENIKQLRQYSLQPKEVQKMLGLLRNPQYALASFEFNETLETSYPARFTEEYDMKVLEEILQLIPKLKKIKRIK